MFPRLSYIEWIEGRPEAAAHDLGSSDLRRDRRSDLDEPVPPRLADRSPPEAETTLREYIADEYGVAESQVLATAGATHAGFLATATALDRARERASEEVDDDEDEADPPTPHALVEKPGYEPLVETPRALGAAVARFRRPTPEAPVEPDRIAAAAADLPGPVAHVTVTNRHNPTGRLTDRATLAAAADAAGSEGAVLLVDEVYAPYADGDADGDRTAFGGPTAAGLAHAVAVGSLTKFHGLGGLRVGWLVGPEAFLERAREIEAYLPALADPSVALARRFFAHREDLVADARAHCLDNHALLGAFLAERSDLSGLVHPGAPFAYLEHERADGDRVAEAAWEAGVLVVPGRFFGLPEGVRVSLGRDPADCEAALEAFGTVLDAL